MKLELTKPIVFFDLETTGVDVTNDRIIEISLVKILTNDDEEKKTLRINPTIPISAEATLVHGITNEDLLDEPTFSDEAKNIAKFIEGCDLAGFNSNRFDIPMLAEEFLRADIDIDLKKHRFVDAQVIFHKMEQRTLIAAYKFYCNKNLENAHSAEADTIATYEILKAQIEKYDNLENDIESLSKFSSHNKNADFAGRIIFNSQGEEIFNFGKYKGQLVEKVLEKDSGYYGWILKSDFPLYTKKTLTAIKLRNFNS
ncbi:MAG: 3'-5' exonuclease [Bacteroidales bacterium]|jgi:DNA polymerase-3 subunit epsilon|nr:3'-5' exonuclease [Bacteroidales bacterium]